jgi:hypothetical protein
LAKRLRDSFFTSGRLALTALLDHKATKKTLGEHEKMNYFEGLPCTRVSFVA